MNRSGIRGLDEVFFLFLSFSFMLSSILENVYNKTTRTRRRRWFRDVLFCIRKFYFVRKLDKRFLFFHFV